MALVAIGSMVPPSESLLGVSIVVALVAVALQSIARGLDARFGWMWGWIYPEPTRLTGFDRLVGRWTGASRV